MTIFHKIKWITLSVIATLFIILVGQNTGVMSIQFMGWKLEASRVLLISGIGLGGFVAGVLTVLLVQRNQHRIHRPAASPSQLDTRGER